MTNIDLKNLTIASTQSFLKEGGTVESVVQKYLEEIEQKNSDLNIYLEVFSDAIEQARVVDQKIKEEGLENLPLAGVPLAIKDNILIEGRNVSAASKVLTGYKATYDATVISKLKSAGAIFLGRANMDEFAMGGSTENSAFGVTKNPYNADKVAGGSSGGSAAAVGGDMALASLGSDTGGSIRQPASFCGVVGLKPTYGAVSRFGLIAMASSLDQIGPITKNVADAETIFKVIAGADELDSTSAPYQFNEQKKEVLTIGVPYDFIAEGVDGEVLENFHQTITKLKEAGHIIKEVSLPNLKYSLAAYYVLMPAESSSNLGRFDGLRYGLAGTGDNLLEDYKTARAAGFGQEVRRRIILGTYVLSAGYYDAYYGKAVAVRELIRGDYMEAFDEKMGRVDVIMTPTAPTPAWTIGDKDGDPLKTYLEDIFTVPVNLAGIPALSVPTGFNKKGLPLGVQICANYWAENTLFNIGKVIENFTK
ncbi:MAG TPA: Asp-tRNA(Asn)/Glu-tRNA(Gln) amidotransferase subunit GatA [Candidatus Paceibacterota bacterium]